MRATPSFGKSMEVPAEEPLQYNCKPKRIVTNNEPNARQAYIKEGFVSKTDACTQKEWDYQYRIL
jgi:hypothetical protein